MRGMRPTQEDTVVIHTNSIENVGWRAVREFKSTTSSGSSASLRDMGICAVFDGQV